MMEQVLLNVGLVIDISALGAVVLGHFLVPKDPQLSLEDFLQHIRSYFSEESTLSN